jgi:hypothetical protein
MIQMRCRILPAPFNNMPRLINGCNNYPTFSCQEFAVSYVFFFVQSQRKPSM